MDQVDAARVEKLCPALRAIVDAEIRAGNRVAETWDRWGFVIMLGTPFVLRHMYDANEIQYRDVDDPHYWKSEYRCATHGQAVACRF